MHGSGEPIDRTIVKGLHRTNPTKATTGMDLNQSRKHHIEFVYPNNDPDRAETLVTFSFNDTRNSAKRGHCKPTPEQPRNANRSHPSMKRSTDACDTHEKSSEPTVQQQKIYKAKLSGVSVEEAIRDETGCRPRANSTDAELNLPRRGLCDEGMVLQSHIWSVKWRQLAPKGFVNLGNTCFLNAILQCLAYNPPFCQCLTSLGTPSGTLSQGQRITELLRRLFRQVHDLDISDSTGGGAGALSPRQFVNTLPMLGSIGSRNGYRFRPGRQEDAHEFLVHLLDAMHDGELKSAGIDQHCRGWRDRLPIPRIDETTLIHRIFGGYLRSQVRCTKCGYCSNTYDPFMDLALEVSKKSCSSVQSAFQEFTRKETLDSQNRWRCSGCLKNVRATKQLTVFRPPLSLCIQLKRFAFSNGLLGSFSKGIQFSGMGGSKVRKTIEFPALLQLSLSDGRQCEYSLTGIVVHLGVSATTGHYTSFVKKPSSSGQPKWYHMDDSYVEQVSEKTVLRQKDAYVLFYCRTEVRLELPCPPLRSSMSAQEAKDLVMARSRARSSLNLSVGQPVDMRQTEPADLNVAVNARNGKLTVVTETESHNGVIHAFKEDLVRFGGSAELIEAPSRGTDEWLPFPGVSNHESLRKRHDGDGMVSDGLSGVTLSNMQNGEVTACSSTEKHFTSHSKTRVILDRVSRHGRLEVMIGPRYKKKPWKPKVATARTSDPNLELLGTKSILKWREGYGREGEVQSRGKAIHEFETQAKRWKNYMYLDRWDSLLDQGKKKKIRSGWASSGFHPAVNPFHRIQSGMQQRQTERAISNYNYSGKGTKTLRQESKSKPNYKKRKRA